MKILIVEDNSFVAEALSEVLASQNYATEIAYDGQEGWNLIENFDYDLVVLDIMLPKLDGISLCRQIRGKGLLMPILLLTGINSSHDKAVGLDAGADDYVVKPFDNEEFIARVRALLRRGGATSQPILNWGELSLDPISYEVLYKDELLSLTPKEYGLLELFLRNSRRVFSCGMILEHLWSYEDTPGEEAVRTHIKGLRHKLKSAGAPHDLIETVYGIGYRLKTQDISGQGSSNIEGFVNSNQQLPNQNPDKQTLDKQTLDKQALDKIAGLWEKYKGRVRDQLDIVNQAAIALLGNALNDELLQQAQQQAHTLAGSLGTFGFSKASNISRNLETLLKTKTVIEKSLNQNQSQYTHQNLTENNQADNITENIGQNIGQNIYNLVQLLYIELKFKENTQTSHQTTDQISIESQQDCSRQDCSRQDCSRQDCSQQDSLTDNSLTEIADSDTNRPTVNILAVDDDETILALLKTLLTPWGLRVNTLENPTKLWETLESVNPDLLILDVEMPQGNGIDICQEIRNHQTWSELPVIFLTVHSNPEIVNQVFSVGADDFINKPIVGPELVTRIINRIERLKLGRWIRKEKNTQLNNQLNNQLNTQQPVSNSSLISSSLDIRLQQQATVALLGQSALSSHDLSALMNEAVELVAKNLNVEYCKILEILPEGNVLLLKAGIGWHPGLVGVALLPLNESQAGYTLLVKEPVIVEDLSTDNRFHSPFLLEQHQVVSGLSVPIIGSNGAYGVLGGHTQKKQIFTQYDINFLQAVANVLAGAIEKKHTEESLQRAKYNLELRVAERTAELITVNQKLQLELTERVRTQSALHNSQALFSGIVEIADDAIISIDRNQTITLFNQGAERIFGYRADEVIGQPLDLLIPSRYIENHHDYIISFGQSDNTRRRMGDRREIYGCRKEGSEFPAEASISKLTMGDEIVYTVYLQDVSRRKQVEKMKDEFVSVVSHELRTPLTSIYGSLGMLSCGLIKPESDQGKRLLEIATESTERLVRLINDILDIERIESGKVKMEKQICYLTDLISEAVNIIQPLADKADVTLSVNNLSINLFVDPDRIIQSLTNLLSNAIKFSKPGDTVWLSVEEDNNKDNNINHKILFTIKDTGRGIPADKLDTVFERFQQVDSSDSRNHDGTGLGLAICKSIIQQHGGEIWVESILGEGSTFYFTLPLNLPLYQKDNPPDNFYIPYSPLIMICDDESQTRGELKALLEQKNYRVITAASGEEAITLALSEHPNAILLDLAMPGLDGWQVMAVLKEHPETHKIPIIICSIFTPEDVCQPPGEFDDWVCKPVEETSLFESLRQVLANASKKLRVLVVEDDVELAELLVTLLKTHHIETWIAKTGREAIHLSQELKPDLLILDLILPEGDGFRVVDWLQQHNQLYNIPLVVYSAKDLDEPERNRLKLGDTEFLSKGRVTVQEFEQKVMTLLQQITNKQQDH
jgi:PAS domain S-box-containing protein